MTSSSEDKPKQAAIQVALAQYTPVAATEKEDRSGWVTYGDDNLYPQYLRELAETSPVHGALCKSIAQMIAGKGITSNSLPAQSRLAQLKATKLIEATAADLKMYGGYYWEIIWTLDETQIAAVNHLPYENVRLCVSDEHDDIKGVYYSRDWSAWRKAKNKPQFIPIADPKAEDQLREVYISFVGNTSSRYYPMPDYLGAMNYIELSRQISMYHVNNIMNGLFPSFIIQHFNGAPDPETRAMMIRDWENNLSGARNAGKFLMLFQENDQKESRIDTFPISDADKQYQFLSDLSTGQIMIGHRVTSPLLFGIRDGSGLGSNENEMKQALAIFNEFVIEPFQRDIEEGLNEILKMDGVIAQIKIERRTPGQVTLAREVPELSDDTAKCITEALKGKAEYIDTEEWELIHEDEAGSHEEEQDETKYVEELNRQAVNLGLEDYANGGDKSAFGDAGLYKLRYAYSQNLSADTREFCREMVAMSQAGAVFRYEDIQAMGDDGVNGQFAPEGQSAYDIFLWKGGAFCHHFWKRQIYFRKRGAGGAFLPNDGLKNDKRVGNVPYVPRKGREGVAPINTPSRGSLKYG